MGPVEVLWDGHGVPPERIWDQWKYYGMDMGYTPRCEQTENITLIVLRTRAVKTDVQNEFLEKVLHVNFKNKFIREHAFILVENEAGE